MSLVTGISAGFYPRGKLTSGFAHVISIGPQRLVPGIEAWRAPDAPVTRQLHALPLIEALALELGCDSIVLDIDSPARDAFEDSSSGMARGRGRNGDPFPWIGLDTTRRLEKVG